MSSSSNWLGDLIGAWIIQHRVITTFIFIFGFLLWFATSRAKYSRKPLSNSDLPPVTPPTTITIQCPGCLHSFRAEWKRARWDFGADAEWIGETSARLLWVAIARTRCPACGKLILKREHTRLSGIDRHLETEEIFYPRKGPQLLSDEIPAEFRADFNEASEVLIVSEKASAALSRRCLQRFLEQVVGIQPSDLVRQIEQAKPHFSPALAGAMDHIRVLGNFAAHPIKSTNTGEVLDVEPGEAEYALDVLKDLLEYWFVETARHRERKTKLNEKLNAAGRRPLK
jgi:hypothetical protein